MSIIKLLREQEIEFSELPECEVEAPDGETVYGPIIACDLDGFNYVADYDDSFRVYRYYPGDCREYIPGI